MKRIKELYLEDKPREKLMVKGVSALQNYELVAIVLGSGIKGKDIFKLSREIVKMLEFEFDTLSLEKLLKVHGLGKAKSAQIISAIELSRRYLTQSVKKINSSNDVYNQLQTYKDKKQEYFLALYLDGANNLCTTKVITIGTLNQSLVHPREVFSYAIEQRCAGVIVAHNHPSGILSASLEDIEVTKRLNEAGKILGIELLDHIIFTKEGFISLKEEYII